VAVFDDEEEPGTEPAADAAPERSRMSFLEHLEELRKRILYSVYATVAGCALTFYFADKLYKLMLGYFQVQVQGKLLATELSEPFMFQLKIAFFAGLILAAPFIFYQVWQFVAPGLYAKEKKVVWPFVASATILFSGGVWFNHRLAFPAMAMFFSSFRNESLEIMPTIKTVWSFYVKMAIGLGLVFEMPVLVYFLARFGIVTWRWLLKMWKYAILVIFILAALITPSPDMVTQCVFAAPMLVLYGISIGVAWMFGKKKTAEEE